MSDQDTNGTRKGTTARSGDANAFTELRDLVVEYARQETVGQLARLGKWIGLGLAGAVAVSIGIVFGSLALLRALQTETGAFDGSWSWVPYVILLLALVTVAALVLSAMTRDPNEDRP